MHSPRSSLSYFLLKKLSLYHNAAHSLLRCHLDSMQQLCNGFTNTVAKSKLASWHPCSIFTVFFLLFLRFSCELELWAGIEPKYAILTLWLDRVFSIFLPRVILNAAQRYTNYKKLTHMDKIQTAMLRCYWVSTGILTPERKPETINII